VATVDRVVFVESWAIDDFIASLGGNELRASDNSATEDEASSVSVSGGGEDGGRGDGDVGGVLSMVQRQ